MSLSDYDKELLTIMMEECAEVIQACSKIIRFGDGSENLKELEKELGDLQCMIDLLHQNDYISFNNIDNFSKQKKEKLKIYSNLFDGT